MSRRVDWPLSIVIALSILAAICVALWYIPRAIIGWDEAHYLTQVYQMTQAVRSGNVSQIISISRTMYSPPPMQAWLLALPLAVTGYSHMWARLFGLLFFIATALGTYALGCMTDPRRGKIVGLVGAMFILTSPMMLFFASIAEKEMLGAAFTVITVFLYVHARKQSQWYWDIGVGVSIAMSIFIKFPYGILLGAGITIEGCISFFSTKRKIPFIMHHVLMLIVPVLSLAWWTFTPYNQLGAFIETIQNIGYYTTNMVPYWSTNQLLFYPRAILFEYSASIWIGGMLLAACLSLPWIWKRTSLRLSWLLFVINIVTGTVHIQIMFERFIFTTAPFLFVIGSYSLVRVVDWAVAHRSKSTITGLLFGAGAIILALVCIDIGQLKSYVYAVGSYTNKTAMFNQRNYTDLWFNYDRSKWSYTLPTPPFEEPKDVVNYVVTTADPHKPIQLIGYANELSPWYFDIEEELALTHTQSRQDGYSRYIAVLHISPTSRLYTYDYQYLNQIEPWNIPPQAPDPSWTLIGQRNFRDLGVDVSVYGT